MNTKKKGEFLENPDAVLDRNHYVPEERYLLFLILSGTQYTDNMLGYENKFATTQSDDIRQPASIVDICKLCPELSLYQLPYSNEYTINYDWAPALSYYFHLIELFFGCNLDSQFDPDSS